MYIVPPPTPLGIHLKINTVLSRDPFILCKLPGEGQRTQRAVASERKLDKAPLNKLFCKGVK